jgi:hypothetical protein
MRSCKGVTCNVNICVNMEVCKDLCLFMFLTLFSYFCTLGLLFISYIPCCSHIQVDHGFLGLNNEIKMTYKMKLQGCFSFQHCVKRW